MQETNGRPLPFFHHLSSTGGCRNLFFNMFYIKQFLIFTPSKMEIQKAARILLIRTALVTFTRYNSSYPSEILYLIIAKQDIQQHWMPIAKHVVLFPVKVLFSIIIFSFPDLIPLYILVLYV
jgi:hypothetical protein